jgi:hypothetical protein
MHDIIDPGTGFHGRDQINATAHVSRHPAAGGVHSDRFAGRSGLMKRKRVNTVPGSLCNKHILPAPDRANRDRSPAHLANRPSILNYHRTHLLPPTTIGIGYGNANVEISKFAHCSGRPATSFDILLEDHISDVLNVLANQTNRALDLPANHRFHDIFVVHSRAGHVRAGRQCQSAV